MSKVKLSDIAQAINQKGKPLIGEMEETQQLLDGRIQALREQRNKLVAIQAEAKRALREAQEAERAAQAAAEAAGEIPAEAAAPAVDAPAADAPVAPAAEQKPKVEAAPVVPSEFIRSAMQQPPRTPRQRPSGQDGRPPMRAPQGGQGGPAGQGGPGGQRPPRAGQGGPPRGEGQRYPRQGGAPGSGAAGGARGPQPGRPPARPGNAAPAAGARKPRAAGGAPMGLPPVGEKERVSNYDPNRAAYNKNASNDRKPKNKKQLMKENMAAHRGEENTFGSRKRRNKRYEPKVYIEPIKIDHAVIATETVTIKELSEKIGKPSGEIIKKLILLGIIATINQEIDFDTAQLVASEFGVTLEQKLEKTFEEVMQEEVGLRELEVNDTGAIMRAPVVTVMGHVDHGKTSLLDALRRTRVAASEAGGITQHIGASAVELNGRTITFLDTPGHEAFTAMRARGANCTDIAVLVVAADDGIMPQTVEAIHHAQAAEVPIIVAINKIDKEGANVERVKQELTEHNVLAEEWGGETIMVPVSAVTEEGLDTLLEMILLQADVMELKANPDRPARGIIVEAQLDRGRGPVATVLVQNGTLRPGDTIVAGTAYGRVRAMLDDKGNKVEAAGPSQPVVVLGFSEVPHAGDTLNVVEEDKLSRQVAEERRDRIKAQQMKTMSKVTLEDLFSQIADGQVKELNLVIKADVQGSVEAVGQALTRLSNDEVRVKVIHDGVGAINESDIILASASNAIVIGFNVRPDVGARAAADQEKVDVRLYRVIYNAIEDVKNAMLGMLDPEFKEVVYGHAEVRNLFKVSNVGTIAGCYVTDGKIGRNCEVRVLRDNVVVHEGKIDSLKRFKDDVREVATGYECGITLANFNDIKEGDVFEAFVEEEIKRTEV